MDDEEAKRRIKALIEGNVSQGLDRMRSFVRCRTIYCNMKNDGYAKQAESFRAYVLTATISHPDWSELEILTALADRIGMRKEEYA